MTSHDDWKQTDPNDRWPDGEDEYGCTCPRELGAGGVRKTDRNCPLHGEDGYCIRTHARRSGSL